MLCRYTKRKDKWPLICGNVYFFKINKGKKSIFYNIKNKVILYSCERENYPVALCNFLVFLFANCVMLWTTFLANYVYLHKLFLFKCLFFLYQTDIKALLCIENLLQFCSFIEPCLPLNRAKKHMENKFHFQNSILQTKHWSK